VAIACRFCLWLNGDSQPLLFWSLFALADPVAGKIKKHPAMINLFSRSRLLECGIFDGGGMYWRSLLSRGQRGGIVIALLAGCALAAPAILARTQPPVTNVIVLVTDASSNKPLFQARLTLEFRDPQSRRGKTVSLSAKTDLKGEYRFRYIPMAPVVLMVTQPDHQTFGKEFQISQQNQLLRVKLLGRQPLR
jgi:hypothetical protein